MLNEALEIGNGEITSLQIPLGIKNSISLNLVFGQKGKKRHLLEESISFGEIKIDNPFELAYTKAYFRRFVQNKLNPSHKSEFFTLKEISELDEKGKKYLRYSLLVKDSEPKIYLSDIEVEAILDVSRDGMQGFNRAKLFEKYIKAHVTNMQTQIFHLEGDALVMDNFVYNPMSEKAQKLAHHIESRPFNEDEIRAILKEKEQK